MKKLVLVLVVLLLITVVGAGCGKTTKPIPRSIILNGDWTVKKPPRSPIPKGFPKNYTPPSPVYMLKFSTNDGNNVFALTMPDQTSQNTNNSSQAISVNSHGMYILSGNIIQLIPTGKNYVFELGKNKEDDKILGDGFVWTRTNQGNN